MTVVAAAVPVAAEFIVSRMVAGSAAADLVAEVLTNFRVPLGERARLTALGLYRAVMGLAARRLALMAALDDRRRETDGGGGEVAQAAGRRDELYPLLHGHSRRSRRAAAADTSFG